MFVVLAIAFLCGACLGSFLNVCIYRLAAGQSVVQPPSRCGACGGALPWQDNLPILSWLLRRGRCRFCGTHFSARYALLELATGIAVAAVLAWCFAPGTWFGFFRSNLWLQQMGYPGVAAAFAAAVAVAVLAYLLVASMIDIDHRMIPDELPLGMQLFLPLCALVVLPVDDERALSTWPAISWLGHATLEGGWRWTLGSAAGFLAALWAISTALLALSLPVAKHIYSHSVPENQRWRDQDHRAFRVAAWWFQLSLLLPVVFGVIAALCGFWWGAWAMIQAVSGALLAWWLPYGVGLVGTVAFRRNAMGYGDVKFFAPLGALLGPIGVLWAFAAAAAAGALIGVPLRLAGGDREFPFGPSLAIGCIVAWTLAPYLQTLLFPAW